MSAEPTAVAAEPLVAQWDLAAILAGGQAILHGPDGQPVAAVVPIAVLQRLRELEELVEDQSDVILAMEAMLEQARSGEPPISHEQLKAELGL